MIILAVVQARMESTRLPGKVMLPILNKPMIQLLLERLSSSKLVTQIVVATSERESNIPLIEFVRSLGFQCIVGSDADVLSRYVKAGDYFNSDIIVRITGDCPIVDPELVDECIKRFIVSGVDYLSNTLPPSYPDGLDIEVIKFSVLKESKKMTDNAFDLEHVTPYVRNSIKYCKENLFCEKDLSALRWTVDDPEDFEVIKSIFDEFKPNIFFSWRNVYELQIKKPEIFLPNQGIKRNEGAVMGTGQKLWKRAKRVIPGGNMLLSKRPEMFLPDYWPAYYSKTTGCFVWDLDKKKYTDMSIMGIGTNTLGYCRKEVDKAVIGAVREGNMSTLNCPEEVYLSERLIDMHPWADMSRFCRSGGEANAIAVRVARAASGRDGVAVCGYHGWHDWYLSANLSDTRELDGHLLPGLQPNGVPRKLLNSVFTFKYNSISELKDIISKHEIGVIIMEVKRSIDPESMFLNQVREIASANNIVLIFDECTSGFRETFGGLHLKYDVQPDIAMFGKALGNGYAINAVIGKKEVMEYAQSTFISSTFWTERIGSVAALKTLEIMEKNKSWEIITEIGNYIRNSWDRLAEDNNLKITHNGLAALCGFSFDSMNNLIYKTYISQQMLKFGYLASNSVYSCIEHNTDIVDTYIDRLSNIFYEIGLSEKNGDCSNLLDGQPCHSGFKRLN